VKVDNNVSFQHISNVQKVGIQAQDKENKSKFNNDLNELKTEKESVNNSIEDITKTIKGMNDFIKPINTSIHFRLHNELNRYYVELIDKDTDEVIKEIPSEEWLNLYANMLESIGLLVDHKI